jgi:hypothetical protein
MQIVPTDSGGALTGKGEASARLRTVRQFMDIPWWGHHEEDDPKEDIVNRMLGQGGRRTASHPTPAALILGQELISLKRFG